MSEDPLLLTKGLFCDLARTCVRRKSRQGVPQHATGSQGARPSTSCPETLECLNEGVQR